MPEHRCSLNENDAIEFACKNKLTIEFGSYRSNRTITVLGKQGRVQHFTIKRQFDMDAPGEFAMAVTKYCEQSHKESKHR